MSKLHSCIFGPGLSGKTVLARYFSRIAFLKRNRRTLVLDPVQSEWGEQAETFDATREEDFWRMVWSTKDKLVIVDESTEMINRRTDLIPAFTRIRHNRHKLLIVGHRGSVTLLPIMRDQMSSLYLFRQTDKACEVWAEQFVDERIYQATKLKQYQFLWAELWGDVRIQQLTDEQRAM